MDAGQSLTASGFTDIKLLFESFRAHFTTPKNILSSRLWRAGRPFVRTCRLQFQALTADHMYEKLPVILLFPLRFSSLSFAASMQLLLWDNLGLPLLPLSHDKLKYLASPNQMGRQFFLDPSQKGCFTYVKSMCKMHQHAETYPALRNYMIFWTSPGCANSRLIGKYI